MKRTLVVSHRAEADLLEIWLWTQQQFGEDQADRYLDSLDSAMRRCGAEPEFGKDRETLRSGYRSRLIGKHVVFYTFSDAEVVIRRVLHASMDFGEHLPSG